MKKLFLIILICSSLAYAQNKKTERINFWSDVNGSYKLDEKWKLYGDAGYRTVFIINKFQRLYIRPSTSYRLNSFFFYMEVLLFSLPSIKTILCGK